MKTYILAKLRKCTCKQQAGFVLNFQQTKKKQICRLKANLPAKSRGRFSGETASTIQTGQEEIWPSGPERKKSVEKRKAKLTKNNEKLN